MSYELEFKSVDLIVESECETRMVDSFALCLIKAERQIRKIFTYLIFQSSSFKDDDINTLRETLGNFRNIYFDGFIIGINKISKKSLSELYGEKYVEDLNKIKKATKYRNKIFHGQLTSDQLSRDDLLKQVENIKSWCEKIAEIADTHYGYCGFARNSFQKSEEDLSQKITNSLTSAEEYKAFIQEYMTR